MKKGVNVSKENANFISEVKTRHSEYIEDTTYVHTYNACIHIYMYNSVCACVMLMMCVHRYYSEQN